MKQFIVLLAILPILLIFMVQFTLDQRNSFIVGQIQAVVYAAKEDAKQEGRFTAEIKEKMKRDLGRATGALPEEIEIISGDAVKYRYGKGDARLIYYTVKVPIEGVMAGAGFFGIGGEENRYVYTIDSYTASEKI